MTYLPIDSNGLVSLEDLKNAIRDDTIAVSIHTVHNELGVIQDIESIGKICKENKIFFHTDAAQAFGKIDLDVNRDHVDLMSVSGHKIYGPKGIGCLYTRRRPRVKLTALINGGGQERGLRSGTLPTHLCVGNLYFFDLYNLFSRSNLRSWKSSRIGFIRNGNGSCTSLCSKRYFCLRT